MLALAVVIFVGIFKSCDAVEINLFEFLFLMVPIGGGFLHSSNFALNVVGFNR